MAQTESTSSYVNTGTHHATPLDWTGLIVQSFCSTPEEQLSAPATFHGVELEKANGTRSTGFYSEPLWRMKSNCPGSGNPSWCNDTHTSPTPCLKQGLENDKAWRRGLSFYLQVSCPWGGGRGALFNGAGMMREKCRCARIVVLWGMWLFLNTDISVLWVKISWLHSQTGHLDFHVIQGCIFLNR